MHKRESPELAELVFRSFLPWFLLKIAVLIAVGAFFLGFGIQTSNYLWWSGTVIAVLMGVVLTSQYFAEAVIISGNEVVFQYGWLSVQMIEIPVWEIYIEARQNILGRLLDYGTIRYQQEDDTIELKSVTSLRTLRRIMSQRRQELLPLLIAHKVIDVNVITNGVAYGESRQPVYVYRDR